MRIFDSDLSNSISVMRLPAIPGVLARLVEHCQAADADPVTTSQFIGLDPGLTSKVFSAVNSGRHGGETDLTSVEQAVTLLGPEMIRTLVMKEAVAQSFSHAAADRADLRFFWKHSVTAALIARMLAAKLAYPRIEEAYLAGLLHDIGRLALLSAFPHDYASLFPQADGALCVREQKLLRLTHAQAGARIAEKWQLDSFLSDSILYHHEPPARLTQAHLLIRIVAVAHALANDGPDAAACRTWATLLDVTAAELNVMHAGAANEVARAAQEFAIDFSRPAEAPLLPGSIFPLAKEDSGRAALSDKISARLLASEARQSFNCKQDQAELFKSVLQTARMVFSSRSAMVVQLNENGDAYIVAAADQYSRAINEFSLPIDAGGVIIENALHQRLSFIDRSSTLLGITELQALRLLHAESLVSIPFGDSGCCAGMLLLGLDAETRQDLHQRQSLLEAFAQQVSGALQAMTAGQEAATRRITDVTEEFQAMARHAAHEVNNPLTIMQNYFSVLERKLVKHELGGAEIPLLREEVDRIVSIVHGLCEFQPSTANNQLTDLRSVIQNIEQLFQQTEFLPPSVHLTSRTPDEPLEVDTDIDTVKQILINLIKNAAEALPHGGEIEVRISSRLANRDGRLYVVLSVSDSGTGIPEEIMARLFSPVPSNKGAGYHGLGLSIVNHLVKAISGFITCHSDQNGTRFEILLPVTDRASKTPISSKYATRAALSS